jgi:hypothetical protein
MECLECTEKIPTMETGQGFFSFVPFFRFVRDAFRGKLVVRLFSNLFFSEHVSPILVSLHWNDQND